MKATAMDPGERTMDVYERLPGYSLPPLVPFIPPTTDALVTGFRARPNFATRWLIRTIGPLTGAQRFFRRLAGPEQEHYLRRIHSRLLIHPLLNAATVALDDDPRCRDAIMRSTTLIAATREFYLEMKSGRLAPDRVKEQPCEMGQFPNLFATSLLPQERSVRLFKSARSSRIAVLAGGRTFLLELGDDRWSPAEIASRLRVILDTVGSNPAAQTGVGLIASASARWQEKLFPEIEARPENAESLAALRHTFLTLSLDHDASPRSAAEAARLAHSGNPGNRWMRSTFNLVVFGNGRAAAICSFSGYLDGNTMGRASSEIQTRGLRQPCPKLESAVPATAPRDMELRWNLEPEWLRTAASDVAEIQDSHESTFELENAGTRYFTDRQLKPVPAFTIAMQLALKRLTGKMGLSQFLGMSMYRCLGVKTTNVTTPETERFIAALLADGSDRSALAAQLDAAIESQIQQCRRARSELGFNTALGLFFSSRSRAQAWWLGVLMRLLRQVGSAAHFGQMEVIVSHINIYPGVRLIGRPGIRLPRGPLALHYQLFPNVAVLTVMPNADGKLTSAAFISALRQAVEEIGEIARPVIDRRPVEGRTATPAPPPHEPRKVAVV